MQHESQSDELSAAVLLLEGGDCFGAVAALVALEDAGALPPEGQEALARAAWLCGELDTCISAYERAYRGYLDVSNPQRAGYVALMLCWEHEGMLASARARGWRRRGERLLDSEPDSAEHGYLAWFRGRSRLFEGDLSRAHEELDDALALAERYADRDLEALARWYQGYVLLQSGEFEKGWASIDEAMAAASGGELSAYFAGYVYCVTVSVCRETGDYRRAAEWTEAQKRWCEQTKVAIFPSLCRVNRAAVLGKRGAWEEAEREAEDACRELERLGFVGLLGDAFYEIGELRLRRGDHAGAERALLRAHELGWDPQPALAQLRLAQRRAGDARALLELALAEAESNPLRVLPLAPALVEAALADGDLEAARIAYRRLELVAPLVETPYGKATVATTSGRLRLAEGDAEGAIEDLQLAVRLWREEVQTPFESARAQLALAEARAARGEMAAAALEARAVLATFERLGAIADADGARALIRRLGPAGETAARHRVQRAFLFTDLVKSTELLEAIGDDAWQHLLAWHDAKLRALFRTHRGEEVDHAGDGFFVSFPDAATAVECASAIQCALADHQRQTGFAPQLRAGIHAAEATRQDSSYRGRGVHIAARIAAQAKAGEILVSREAAEDIADRYRLEDRGDLQLKGITQPIAVVAVEWRD